MIKVFYKNRQDRDRFKGWSSHNIYAYVLIVIIMYIVFTINTRIDFISHVSFAYYRYLLKRFDFSKFNQIELYFTTSDLLSFVRL